MDLRPALALEKKPDGSCAVLDRVGQARHPVPSKLAAAVEAAFVEGSPRDPEATAWLELRHLAMSDRVQRVESWAASRLPRAVPRDKRPITMLPRSRFTCHGCGMCCESYVAGPVSGVERERILARASALAPHVRAPVESWFVPTATRASRPGSSGGSPRARASSSATTGSAAS